MRPGSTSTVRAPSPAFLAGGRDRLGCRPPLAFFGADGRGGLGFFVSRATETLLGLDFANPFRVNGEEEERLFRLAPLVEIRLSGRPVEVLHRGQSGPHRL